MLPAAASVAAGLVELRRWALAPFRTLSARIALPATFFVLVSVALLSAVLIRAQREQVLAEAIHGSESLVQAILLSVDHDMRVNRRDGVREVVETVGGHAGIEALRTCAACHLLPRVGDNRPRAPNR